MDQQNDMPRLIGPDGMAMEVGGQEGSTLDQNPIPIPITPDNSSVQPHPLQAGLATPRLNYPQLSNFVLPPPEALNANYSAAQLQQYAASTIVQTHNVPVTTQAPQQPQLIQQMMSLMAANGPILHSGNLAPTPQIQQPPQNVRPGQPVLPVHIGHQVPVIYPTNQQLTQNLTPQQLATNQFGNNCMTGQQAVAAQQSQVQTPTVTKTIDQAGIIF